MKFKKGQIIPRWIGARTSDRKAQHGLKFGGNVSYENGVIYLESDNGCAIVCDNPRRRMNNGTYKRSGATFEGVHIDASRVKKSTGITLHCNE